VGIPRPAGVLFDAGGTLVQVHVERLAHELRVRGHDPAELDEAFWRTLVLLDAEFGPQAGGFDSWWQAWLDRWADHCSIPAPVLTDAWNAADREESLWAQPIPGAMECLTRLREAGIPLGIVSNADGRVAASLGRLGLAPFFDVIVDSGVVGVSKPDPRIFDHALGVLGTPRDRTWYLGDTVAYDAAAADAAGLVSWVVDHRGLHTADHPRRVGSLAEFADAALAGT
jgi:HAD superfamily hydrolase (TIGR01509 family)